MLVLQTLIECIAIVSASIVALFALSQGWLAINYRRSKLRTKHSTHGREWQGPLPRVLLQLPVFNERYVIARLLEAVSKLDYPADLLAIQLLDDSTDETSQIAARMVAELKKKGMRIQHIHRTDRIGYKAGALQAGLALNTSEFVTIFDADFIPHSTFLKQIIAYFNVPNIGMVQTRWEHLNAEYSLLTKLLSFGIDAHFSVEQGGRQATNSFINFNGTAGMWRRKAIDEAGGWHNDCLTEDLDLSFRTQLRGWKFLFVEEITTPSELPVEMSAIRTQQFRWTKGAAETGRKNFLKLWSSKFPFSTKLTGSFHMLNSLIFPNLLVLSLSLAALPFVFGARTSNVFLLINALLLISAVIILFTYWIAHRNGGLLSSAKGTTTILVRAILFLLITSGLSIHNGLAAVQGLLGRVTPFMRTPKLNIIATGQKITGRRTYLPVFLYPLLAAELSLAVLFSGLAIYCSCPSLYAVVPGFAFFAAGYLMVGYFTVLEMLEAFRLKGAI